MYPTDVKKPKTEEVSGFYVCEVMYFCAPINSVNQEVLTVVMLVASVTVYLYIYIYPAQ